ncbi:hypothetical protein ACFL3V_07085, partial [Nanoarchaeota archaeon]
MAFSFFKKKEEERPVNPAVLAEAGDKAGTEEKKTVINAPPKEEKEGIIFKGEDPDVSKEEKKDVPAVAERASEKAVDDKKTIISPNMIEPKQAAKAEKPEDMLPKKGEEDTAPDKEGFFIDLRPKIIELPPYKDKKEINVRYPVIPPYAYIHIYFDKKENELIYAVEEPVLDDTETQILELIQLGLEEMINISFVRAAKSNIILQYLEKNVQSILVELGTKVSKKTYNKLMYYVYRNSVGLNEIEPLLNDYYVEDIECNGTKF